MTGIATALPACDTTFWEVFGIFTREGGQYNYEMTVVNPLGMADSGCTSLYKIKGLWPDGDWYFAPPTPVIHETGNAFTWQKCSNLQTYPERSGRSGKRQLK